MIYWIWLIAKIAGACSLAMFLLLILGAVQISGRESERERQQFGEDE